MRSIFLLRAFAPSWQTSFRSEAEKNFFSLSFVCKELKFFFYECLNLGRIFKLVHYTLMNILQKMPHFEKRGIQT
jgi:hypothetical protein